MIYELKAIHDNRKSFYGKAIIENCDGIKYILFSYGTEICEYYPRENKLIFLTDCLYHFTTTTNRHINEFIKQFAGMTGKSKKELLNMAGIII